MSLISLAHSGEAAAIDLLRKEAGNYAERYRKWRLYRASIAELSALSSRELADLGLHRGNVRSAARAAVYGVN